MARSSCGLWLAALLLATTGCTTTSTQSLEDVGPTYSPSNVSGARRWPGHVRRVAILPVADATATLPPAFLTTYDAPWSAALQQSQRAEFVVVDRATYARWTGGPQAPASNALLPSDWAQKISAATGAEAAMLVEVTRCSPYAPLALGLRAKLIDLRTAEVLWAVDEVFDAADPTVARAARRHANPAPTPGLPKSQTTAGAVLQSPSQFAEYATTAIANMLPVR